MTSQRTWSSLQCHDLIHFVLTHCSGCSGTTEASYVALLITHDSQTGGYFLDLCQTFYNQKMSILGKSYSFCLHTLSPLQIADWGLLVCEWELVLFQQPFLCVLLCFPVPVFDQGWGWALTHKHTGQSAAERPQLKQWTRWSAVKFFILHKWKTSMYFNQTTCSTSIHL